MPHDTLDDEQRLLNLWDDLEQVIKEFKYLGGEAKDIDTQHFAWDLAWELEEVMMSAKFPGYTILEGKNNSIKNVFIIKFTIFMVNLIITLINK